MLNDEPEYRKSFSSLLLILQNYEAQIEKTIFSEMDYLEQKKTFISNDNYEDLIVEANFNKKCQMYREAISKYLMSYHLIKGQNKITIN